MSQPLHISGLPLDRERPIEAHALASTDVKASHSARGSISACKVDKSPRLALSVSLSCSVTSRTGIRGLVSGAGKPHPELSQNFHSPHDVQTVHDKR